MLQVAAHLALPVLALVMLQAGSLTRYVRASMLDVVKMDFIRTARAKGLHERTVILKHALRNALLPIITLLLTVNLALGLLNRMAPQLSVFVIGFPFVVPHSFGAGWVPIRVRGRWARV